MRKFSSLITKKGSTASVTPSPCDSEDSPSASSHVEIFPSTSATSNSSVSLAKNDKITTAGLTSIEVELPVPEAANEDVNTPTSDSLSVTESSKISVEFDDRDFVIDHNDEVTGGSDTQITSDTRTHENTCNAETEIASPSHDIDVGNTSTVLTAHQVNLETESFSPTISRANPTLFHNTLSLGSAPPQVPVQRCSGSIKQVLSELSAVSDVDEIVKAYVDKENVSNPRATSSITNEIGPAPSVTVSVTSNSNSSVSLAKNDITAGLTSIEVELPRIVPEAVNEDVELDTPISDSETESSKISVDNRDFVIDHNDEVTGGSDTQLTSDTRTHENTCNAETEIASPSHHIEIKADNTSELSAVSEVDEIEIENAYVDYENVTSPSASATSSITKENDPADCSILQTDPADCSKSGHTITTETDSDKDAHVGATRSSDLSVPKELQEDKTESRPSKQDMAYEGVSRNEIESRSESLIMRTRSVASHLLTPIGSQIEEAASSNPIIEFEINSKDTLIVFDETEKNIHRIVDQSEDNIDKNVCATMAGEISGSAMEPSLTTSKTVNHDDTEDAVNTSTTLIKEDDQVTSAIQEKSISSSSTERYPVCQVEPQDVVFTEVDEDYSSCATNNMSRSTFQDTSSNLKANSEENIPSPAVTADESLPDDSDENKNRILEWGESLLDKYCY